MTATPASSSRPRRRPCWATSTRTAPSIARTRPRSTRWSTGCCCRTSTPRIPRGWCSARHWNTATPEQRQRFVDGFYHSLLNNYGTALLDFTSDRLKVFPYKAGDGPNANNATVRTQVRKDDGSTVAVNYSLHRTDKGWMAWDVIIEGISYVKSFRDDFGAEIDQKGLDAVIQRLESQAASGKSVAKRK